MKLIREIIQIFKDNSKTEIIFVIPILILFMLICFLIPSFSALPIFNYITMGVVGILCVLILIWKFLFQKILIDRYFILIVIFNFAIIISDLLNVDSSHIFTYLTLSIMSFCLYQFFLEKNYRAIVHHLIFISFCAFALYFIFSYKTLLFDFSIERIGDKFDNLNTVGYYFLYAFISSIALIKRKEFATYLYLMPSFVFLFLLYRTGSRSSLLLALLIALVYVFYFFNGLKIYIPIIVDFCIVSMIFIIAIICERIFEIQVFSRIIEFFNSLFGNAVDYSTENRIELAFQSFSLFLKKPIFGWGNNVFSIYSSERLFAHNNITELLCDFGIVGFLPFELIVICGYIRIKKQKQFSTNSFFCLLLLTAFFGIQFFYVNSQLKFDWIVLAIISAQANCVDNHVHEPKLIEPFKYREINI